MRLDTDDARRADVRRSTRVYQASYAAVVRAAHDVLLDEGVSLVEDRALDDKSWLLIGENDVEKREPKGALVRLYSKRVVATNVAAKDDFTELFDRIDGRLATSNVVAE